LSRFSSLWEEKRHEEQFVRHCGYLLQTFRDICNVTDDDGGCNTGQTDKNDNAVVLFP